MLTNKFPFQIASHDYNTVVSMHLTSQLMAAGEDDKTKKNLQIEQQDLLLGKEDLEKASQAKERKREYICRHPNSNTNPQTPHPDLHAH